ncbi:hypothetical protein VSA01S_14090 [Vibrio sagamiensis NBRC 104589]|uniref:Sel1 repeat family protein n=1 Tax=Vibrio sagamiensis NBRC 104589 TaxID=1219064 RepID=A0A511QDQ5_9VIBR|nr:hypothetical protein VSA01S_14090 [Vibrio sagamiensis NBRC 104589]
MLKKRLFAEKIQRETAYRNTILKAKEQDQQERVFKAEAGHVPTILYLAKEAEKGNLSKALYWYKKAAHLDNVTGMYGVIRLSERMRDDIVLKQQINFWRLAIKGIEGDLEAKLSAGKALVTGSGALKPHTIIKALDKIYKRVSFTPSEVVGVQESQSNAPESFEENLTSINDQQNSSKLEEKPLSKDALDFTHTFLQPQQTKPPQF